MFSRSFTLLLTLLIFSAVSLGNTTPETNLIIYDPSLGTVPESQGFTRIETGPAIPPTVGGGILHQFPVTGTNVQFWQVDNVPLDFASTSYVLEANLRVTSSNYIADIFNVQRSGYYLWAIDAVGRSFAIGVASNGITINTDGIFSIDNGVLFTPFNTTDSFHTYRLVIENGLGTLFIDGTLFASTPLEGAVRPDALNRVLFGDASGVGISETDLSLFRLASVASAIPVVIDIKPRNFPNSINIGSNGSVPVAILSTPNFDASTVNPITLTLAVAEVSLRGKGTAMASFEDVNGDGLLDLVVHINTEALQLSESDTEAVLEGQTFSEIRIRGVDSVRVVP